jgi:ClpP class serine protease
MIQARVDEIGAKFRATVNSGRARAIADDVMQGQSFTAAESLANGLIDTVSDFGTALSDAGKLGRMEKQKKGK